MTENKRYKLYDVGSGYMTSCGIESESGHCFENMTECCEELNRLSDENEQLKKLLYTYKEMHSIKIIEELQEENGQLKIELENMTERFEYELKMKLKYHSELINCKNGDAE